MTPRLSCGQGHEAELTDYRDKTFDTVLGPVTSLSPGLTAMNDTAAAAGPFRPRTIARFSYGTVSRCRRCNSIRPAAVGSGPAASPSRDR